MDLTYDQIRKLIDGLLVGAKEDLLVGEVVELFEVSFDDMRFGREQYRFKLYGFDYSVPTKVVWRAAAECNQNR